MVSSWYCYDLQVHRLIWTTNPGPASQKAQETSGIFFLHPWKRCTYDSAVFDATMQLRQSERPKMVTEFLDELTKQNSPQSYWEMKVYCYIFSSICKRYLFIHFHWIFVEVSGFLFLSAWKMLEIQIFKNITKCDHQR